MVVVEVSLGKMGEAAGPRGGLGRGLEREEPEDGQRVVY
jgi:hypothetical protein